MKLKIIIGLYAGILLFSGCASNTSVVAGQSASVNAESATKGINKEEPNVNDANLEMARGDDNKYIVQIGIYRLTSLSDGIGELTADGMNFTATDAAGNPIRGIITADGQAATVTFTDSTWDYLQNGSAFQYTKSSDTPNIWNE